MNHKSAAILVDFKRSISCNKNPIYLQINFRIHWRDSEHDFLLKRQVVLFLKDCRYPFTGLRKKKNCPSLESKSSLCNPLNFSKTWRKYKTVQQAVPISYKDAFIFSSYV